MQTEARVGVGVEGGQRALNSSHGGVAANDGGSAARKLPQQQHKQFPVQKSQVGVVSQMIAGGVAGAFGKTCTAPFSRLTILLQVQGMHSDVALVRKTSLWHEASRIITEEGFRAFWKGNLVTIIHRLPYSSVNFSSYEHYKKLLHMIPGLESNKQSMSSDICVHFVGGALAGITAASVTYPLDLVRTRIAAQTNVVYYRGICHTLQTISKEEGILGLYKGLGATLLGVGPSIAISFSVYEGLRSFWQQHRPRDSQIPVSLACGSVSGIAAATVGFSWGGTVSGEPVMLLHSVLVISVRGVLFEPDINCCLQCMILGRNALCHVRFSVLTILTFPLDLVRRRKQLEGAGGQARVYKTGLFGTFKHIIKSEGLRGLYRGILPEYYKVVPGVGICFMTYEKLKAILADTGL